MPKIKHEVTEDNVAPPTLMKKRAFLKWIEEKFGQNIGEEEITEENPTRSQYYEILYGKVKNRPMKQCW